tara:strand:- start:13146 stop:13247 length:102 start_codon:yes stop_codon:yes gene_type:complete
MAISRAQMSQQISKPSFKKRVKKKKKKKKIRSN